ncbi:hypothetical protein B0H14DRAFT_3857236, partial [Mycena olivaceomarginata]
MNSSLESEGQSHGPSLYDFFQGSLEAPRESAVDFLEFLSIPEFFTEDSEEFRRYKYSIEGCHRIYGCVFSTTVWSDIIVELSTSKIRWREGILSYSMVFTIQYSGSPDVDDQAAEWSWLDIPDKRNPECDLTDDFIHAFVDLAGQVADAHGVQSADSFLLRIFGEEGVNALKIKDDIEIKGCGEEATFYSML